MEEFLETTIIESSGINLSIWDILVVALIIAVGIVIQRVVKNLIESRLGEKEGRTKSIVQLSSYAILLTTALLAMQAAGIDITIFLASFTALAFGIGIGLQQTFADFTSGFILLFDRSIAIGDSIELDGEIYKVIKIGLRTSLVESIQDNTLIIPNSQITNSKVDNFSYNKNPSTFIITVGVSYSSDIDIVEEVLLDSIVNVKGVIPGSGVVFLDEFGDSSVNFKLLFDTKKHMQIYRIKSDIRKNIFKNFGDKGVTIPFPQRVVHMEE